MLCAELANYFALAWDTMQASINTMGNNMMNADQLRVALEGRSLRRVATETGISYDALYRFIGKPLSLFDHAILSDYIKGKAQAVEKAGDDTPVGTWEDVADAIEGAK